MSDGSINFPIRSTHPTTPAPGRIKFYTLDDSVTQEPYFMRDDGVPNKLIGPQGIQGVQGTQGIQGVQGVSGNDGSPGPADLAFIFTNTSTITLPNTSSKTFVYGNTFNVSTLGNYVMQAKISIRPSSTSSDMELDWRLDNNVLDDDQVEEYKDSGSEQKVGIPFQIDLGSLSVGNHDIDLYFSKENTGGTAQLKYISVFIWRVS